MRQKKEEGHMRVVLTEQDEIKKDSFYVWNKYESPKSQYIKPFKKTDKGFKGGRCIHCGKQRLFLMEEVLGGDRYSYLSGNDSLLCHTCKGNYKIPLNKKLSIMLGLKNNARRELLKHPEVKWAFQFSKQDPFPTEEDLRDSFHRLMGKFRKHIEIIQRGEYGAVKRKEEI